MVLEWCLLELLQFRREVSQGIRVLSVILFGLSFMSEWQGIEQSSESNAGSMDASLVGDGMHPEDWLEAGIAGEAPSDDGGVSEYELVD